MEWLGEQEHGPHLIENQFQSYQIYIRIKTKAPPCVAGESVEEPFRFRKHR